MMAGFSGLEIVSVVAIEVQTELNCGCVDDGALCCLPA